MPARYIVADVFGGLASLEDDSVDLIFSSPPFLALRSYLPADHPDKGKEIGSEATPADFLDTLLDVVEACDRVLAPHGSLCFELGDTFSGSGGAGGDYNEGGLRDGQPRFRAGYDRRDGRTTMQREDYGARMTVSNRRDRAEVPRQNGGGAGWPDAKSLCLIPTLFAASLAYGYNMLRPERTTPRWRVRNLVVWARPNPPVGALGDKFRPATSYVTVATKSARRYFDLDAVRSPGDVPPVTRNDRDRREPGREGQTAPMYSEGNPAGAPPLDYWVIPTQPYAGSHYATFPSKLVEKPVASMCPRRVCRVCGEPSRRIVSDPEYVNSKTGKPVTTLHFDGKRDVEGENHWDTTGEGDRAATRVTETLGWSDCGHDDWRSGVVLDPFAGSGTTLSVATGHGRDAIGVDLDQRNADLALERVGPMFLTVETLTTKDSA